MLAAALSPGAPLYAAAVSVALAAGIAVLGRGALRRVDDGPEPLDVEAQAITLGE
jgi:hypothetical protein